MSVFKKLSSAAQSVLAQPWPKTHQRCDRDLEEVTQTLHLSFSISVDPSRAIMSIKQNAWKALAEHYT